MGLRYSEHFYNATNPGTFTPVTAPVADNLMVITAHTRAAADVLAGITGWTIVGTTMVSVGTLNDVGFSMFYRVAQAGDTAWSIAASQCDVSYSEWEGFGSLLTYVSATVNAAGNPADVNCGGVISPVSDGQVLIIGAMSAGFENDTASMISTPDAGVTELDDKGGATTNPGRWSGYLITPAAPSGSYTIGATATVSSAGIDQAGITAAFSALPSPPTPGIWVAFANQALPFSTGVAVSSDDPRLARGLPQAAPTGISDDITTRVLRADWYRGGSYDHVGSSGPGGFTIVLNNFDGRFDPDNTASPLYGKLNPGIPVWGGAIKATGALGTAAGTGAVAGFMAGVVREFSPTVRNGERICEVIGDDAFEVYRRSTVSVAPSLSRSHATFRGLILDGVGESSTRRDLAIESGMLPFSAVDSGNALDVLEDLNRATATRHYIRPADTKEDWYAYVTVNKLHKLQSAADQTLAGDNIDDVSGWRVTNANTIEVQRATVVPISVTPNNAQVWAFEDTPFTVTSAARKVIWANFTDYVFEASVDTNVASGSITASITNYGKSAKIEIWATSTAVVGLLRVLGRQVVRGDSITVVAGDEAVGALSGNTIASDYIGQEGAAQGLVNFVVWKYGQPLKRPGISVVSKNAATLSTIFERDLFDVLTMSVTKLSVTSRRVEVVGLRGSVVPGKFYRLAYELQETPNQSALDWFDVNTDSVNGALLIAPL